MLNFWTISAFSAASACLPSDPISQPAQTPVKIYQQKKLTSNSENNPQPVLPTKVHKINHQGILFNLVTFDTRNHHIIAADQPNGPGSKWPNSASAAKEHDGIAAINAGFFTPEGKPLGIVISNGEKHGSFNKSSLGSGIFYHTPNGSTISRSSIWTSLSENPPAHLLQSGSMLLENSKPITGLSKTEARPRSFIATDGKNHWCIGHAGSCTLSQLSDALASIKIPEFTPSTALNLDGGRSSDLWVSATLNGEAMQIRPFWNSPVRNFLILKSN